MYRRTFLTTLGTSLVLPHLANAYAPLAYGPATWRDVLAGSDRVIANFRAEWSLTCQMKETVLRDLIRQNSDYRALTFVDVDWDTFGRSEWVQRRLKVERRSTLIAFKGKREIARLVNEPTERAIRNFLDAAVSA